MSKKIILGVVVAGSGLAATAVRADTYVGNVVLQWGSAYNSSGYGGEFQATLTLAGPPYAYSVAYQASNVEIGGGSSLLNPAVFQTFCIQEGSNDVTFNPSSLYAAVIGGTAQTNDNPPYVETLNPITQVLFAEFWNGTLPGYNFSGTNSARVNSAGELQTAIWYAQGDDSWPGAAGEAQVPDYIRALAWYNDAAAYLANSDQSSYLDGGDASGYQNVEILGLYDDETDALAGGTAGIAQAQLIEASQDSFSPPAVPLPASIWSGLVLLGGLGTFGSVKRNRKQSASLA